MSALHSNEDARLSELKPGVLLYELFLLWGLEGNKVPPGWFQLRMGNTRRWHSVNTVNGMLEECASILARRDAPCHTSPALPHEGIEQPFTPSQS